MRLAGPGRGIDTGRAVIIVAAGSGERLGFEVPKAFVALGGRTLLARSVTAFAGLVDQTVVVAGEDELPRARAEAAAAGATGLVVCAGGSRRQDSVRCGLAHCPPGADLVAVHDAARPLVTPSLIARTFDALEPGWDAVAPALEIVDTLKRIDGERVKGTVPRADLRAVQTPQVFRADVLRRAHEVARDATDDLALVEAIGGAARLIPGERTNLKITYPDDLAIAEGLL